MAVPRGLCELVCWLRARNAMITWTVVRGFGNVKYLNISYVVLFLVPILAELHHKAASASETFGKVFVFPATLNWLYAASLLYAIAIALYQYCCPPIIKRFGTAEDYVANDYDLFLRSNPQHRIEIVLAHLDPTVDSDVQSKIEEILKKKDNSMGMDRIVAEQELNSFVGALHSDAVQRFLVKEYRSQNIQTPVASRISFVSYVLGTLILLVLLVRRSLHVFFLI